MLSPYGTARPCRGCEHWGGDIAGTPSANCQRNGCQPPTSAESGCVLWVRAIGLDDDYLPGIGTGRDRSQPFIDAFDDDWLD